MSKKPLPQIKVPTYTLELPITKKKLNYRPYNTGDERVLLAAMQAKDSDAEFYVNNMIGVIGGTILNDIDINSLPAAEVKLLTIRLRGKASGEMIEFRASVGDDKTEEFSVNADDFFVQIPEDPDFYSINLADDIWLRLRELTFSEESHYNVKYKNNPTEAIFESIYGAVDSIYNNEDVWIVGQDITADDVRGFIEGISGISTKLYDFLKGRAKLAVKATTSSGKEIILSENEVDFLG